MLGSEFQSLESNERFAILSPADIENRGKKLHVLIEDASSRCVQRRRFLYQLGVGEVTYMDGKTEKQFKPDSFNVVMSFAKQHTESETWTCVSKHARDAIKNG